MRKLEILILVIMIFLYYPLKAQEDKEYEELIRDIQSQVKIQDPKGTTNIGREDAVLILNSIWSFINDFSGALNSLAKIQDSDTTREKEIQRINNYYFQPGATVETKNLGSKLSNTREVLDYLRNFAIIAKRLGSIDLQFDPNIYLSIDKQRTRGNAINIKCGLWMAFISPVYKDVTYKNYELKVTVADNLVQIKIGKVLAVECIPIKDAIAQGLIKETEE